MNIKQVKMIKQLIKLVY